MLLIGITGPQGGGKSSVADYLGEILNMKVIHCDDLVHEVLTIELYNQVLSFMGLPKEIRVDRKKLGRLLFKEENKDILEKYNNLIYSIVSYAIKKMLDQYDSIIIDWNFLPITELFDLCYFNILITAPENVRIERVMKRDNISYDYAMLREKRGINYGTHEYDLIVNNDNKQLSDVLEEVKKLLWK